jgi:transcriptional regulator with XRE-family HTH domain
MKPSYLALMDPEIEIAALRRVVARLEQLIETLSLRVSHLESQQATVGMPAESPRALTVTGPASFHTQLLAVLRRASKTQKHLADTLGISSQHLSNLLTGSKGKFASSGTVQQIVESLLLDGSLNTMDEAIDLLRTGGAPEFNEVQWEAIHRQRSRRLPDLAPSVEKRFIFDLGHLKESELVHLLRELKYTPGFVETFVLNKGQATHLRRLTLRVYFEAGLWHPKLIPLFEDMDRDIRKDMVRAIVPYQIPVEYNVLEKVIHDAEREIVTRAVEVACILVQQGRFPPALLTSERIRTYPYFKVPLLAIECLIGLDLPETLDLLSGFTTLRHERPRLAIGQYIERLYQQGRLEDATRMQVAVRLVSGYCHNGLSLGQTAAYCTTLLQSLENK